MSNHTPLPGKLFSVLSRYENSNPPSFCKVSQLQLGLVCLRLLRTVVLFASLILWNPVEAEQTNTPIHVPAGTYRPVIRGPEDAKEVTILDFQLDSVPVTNEDYLVFVRQNPRWRRSQVKRLFADENYLRHWAGDLDPGTSPNSGNRQPVTWVSWFAAKAYARWKGGRLPTTAEWEYAASAGRTSIHLTNDLDYRRWILRWYSTPSPEQLPEVRQTLGNIHGLYDLHGLVWEWTSDFNSALVTGDSRGDTGINRQLFCGGGALDGAARDDFPTYLRFGFRSSLKAAYTVHNLGFRCAYDSSPAWTDR